MAELSKEHIVTIKVLNERGASHCSIARALGVTEGTVRYHLRRARHGAMDGRRKVLLIEKLGLAEAVRRWWAAETARPPKDRPPSVELLHAWLRQEHEYPGSYKSVRKYVRATFPPPKRRPFRRFETPPGAQAQTDWGEFRAVEVNDPSGPVTRYLFVMKLSHSRKSAAVWSRSMDQLAWHHCHNEAFRRLGGIPAVNRIDNLKTGIASGCGPWGVINPAYATYAKSMRFHVDACQGGQAQEKGKVEREVGVWKEVNPGGLCFESDEHLQAWTDAKVEAMERRRRCPATGRSIRESWPAERPFLQALPETLPAPFDIAVMRPVHKDCMVRFENHEYPVPFVYVGQKVEVRGCSGTVQIVDPTTGQVLREFPRHTPQRIIIDPTCYEGQGTDRVEAPRPLGRMARKLQEIAAMPVEARPLDLYAALAEVAR